MRGKTRRPGPTKAASPCAKAALLALLLSGCSATTIAGDAGCSSYAEARLNRPPAQTLTDLRADWASWIADLDDRMTGTCR